MPEITEINPFIYAGNSQNYKNDSKKAMHAMKRVAQSTYNPSKDTNTFLCVEGTIQMSCIATAMALQLP